MQRTTVELFAARFGKQALRFANVGIGREHRFRGVNASSSPATFQVGDKITKH